MPVQTRSKRSFKPWDAGPAQTVTTDFNFEDGVREALERARLREEQGNADNEWSDVELDLEDVTKMPTRRAASPAKVTGKRKVEGSTAVPSNVPGKANRPKLTENQRKAAQKKRKRQHQDAFTWRLPRSVMAKYHHDPYVSSHTPAEEFARAKGAWVALPLKESAAKENLSATDPALAQMDIVPWIGDRTLHVLDQKRRIVAACVGRPKDPSWMSEVIPGVAHALTVARAGLKFGKSGSIPAPPGHAKRNKQNRRGADLKTGTFGASFGGGQKVPGNLKQTKKHQKVFDALMRDPFMGRAIGFASASLAWSFPKFYRYCRNVLARLHIRYPRLKRIHKRSIWSAMSVNFGPRVVTNKHRDNANLADGLCWIMAGGDFDSTRGGHLVLWELGLMIQFPPGSTILIPSSVISHQNTSIGEGETRWSITMFCPGGLFRWSENGYRSVKSIKAGPSELVEQMKQLWAKRMDNPSENYSVYEELPKDREDVFEFDDANHSDSDLDEWDDIDE